MATNVINFGIIGCGGITLQNHLPGLAVCPDVKVVALCDADGSVQASASDNVALTKVEFFVDGVLKCTDLTAPYACTWTVPSNPKGATYLLQSKATDASGNAKASPFIRVTGSER